MTRSGGATGAVALKEEGQPGGEVMSPACFLTSNTGDWDLHEVMLATDHNSVAFIILETFIEHSSILSIIVSIIISIFVSIYIFMRTNWWNPPRVTLKLFLHCCRHIFLSF